MSGIDCLLDSNILIGLLNGDAGVLVPLQQAGATPSRCAYLGCLPTMAIRLRMRTLRRGAKH